MKEKIRNIINDESQFEHSLEELMEMVGKERDQKIVDSVKNMGEENFRAMLSGMRGKPLHVDLPDVDDTDSTKVVPLWRRTYLKVIAVCAVALLVIGVAYKVDFNPSANQSALLFKTYGSFDGLTQKKLEVYKIGDKKRINGKGGKTTAAILEESAKKICDSNLREAKEGVAELKELLTLDYKRSLAPEIHWYLGMGYLRLNMPKDAKIELKYVEKMKGAHASEATDVLKKIPD